MAGIMANGKPDLNPEDLRELFVRVSIAYLKSKDAQVDPVPERITVDSLAAAKWREILRRSNGDLDPMKLFRTPFELPF